MKIYSPICLGLFALTMVSCNSQKETTTSVYPVTQKADSADIYFGEKVNDPYRWLENDTSEATGQWVKAQNDVTFSYLDKITYREKIKKRLEKVFDYERLSAPFKEGAYYYFYK